MKFDLIISNPPYKGYLHLKILDSVLDIGKEIIFVQPSVHFIDNRDSNEVRMDMVNKIKDRINSLILFNGNPVFNIALFVPCAITYLDNKKNNKFNFIDKINKQNLVIENEKISWISLFGYREEYISIYNKIIGKYNSLQDIGDVRGRKQLKNDDSYFVECTHIRGNTNITKSLQDFGAVLGSRHEHKKMLNNKDSYFVEFTRIRGHTNITTDTMFKDDFFTIMSANKKPESGRNPRYDMHWEFKTELEAQNFIYYCKTNFARMCLALFKIDQSLNHGELRSVPVVDFTRSWTNEELYEHFNISKEEQEFIKEVIKPYYD